MFTEKRKIVATFLAALLILVGIFVVVNVTREVPQQTVSVSAPPVAATIVAPPSVWKPIDLSGQWSSDSANPKMIAQITQTTIVVNFVSDDANIIYWHGTFANPLEGQTEIVSKRVEINKAVMSRSASKNFIHAGDKITFEFTALGKTKIVEMTRG